MWEWGHACSSGFLGLSRLLAGVTEVSLDLEEGTTSRGIVPKLETTYPAMRESVSQPDGETLQPPTLSISMPRE